MLWNCCQGEGIARQRRAIIDGLRAPVLQLEFMTQLATVGFLNGCKDSITHGSGETLSTEKISELLLITQQQGRIKGCLHHQSRRSVCDSLQLSGILRHSETWPRRTGPVQFSSRADRTAWACRWCLLRVEFLGNIMQSANRHLWILFKLRSTKWLTTQCDFPTLEKSGVQVEVQKKKSKPTKSQKKVQKLGWLEER